MYTRRRMLIVDGYNVLRSGVRYRNIAGPDYTDTAFNEARDALINDVAVYAGSGMEAVVVFDGGANAHSQGSETMVGRVKVVFSPSGQSADKVIEKLAYDARKRGIETLVVSSDATIQTTVYGDGVTRMSANGFSQEMENYHDEVRAEAITAPHVKNTIAERIPAETLAKLIALRDGK